MSRLVLTKLHDSTNKKLYAKTQSLEQKWAEKLSKLNWKPQRGSTIKNKWKI